VEGGFSGGVNSGANRNAYGADYTDVGCGPQDAQFLQGIATPSPAPTPTRWGDPDPDKFLA